MNELQEYHRPTELPEALQLLTRPDVRTVPLAGGTTLAAGPGAGIQAVVDLRALGLDYVTTDPPEPDARGGPFPLRLGAMASLETLWTHALVREPASGLVALAAQRSAAHTLRGQSTLGGTLATAGAGHPLLVALVALDADVVLWVNGEPRVVAAGAFLGYRPVLLAQQHGLIIEARVARSYASTGGALESVARTPPDAPIVVAAARVFRNRENGRAYGVRIAIGGAGPQVVRLATAEGLLEGQVVEQELLARVGAIACETVEPAGDWLGSVEYRRALAGVLAQRAVESAWARSA